MYIYIYTSIYIYYMNTHYIYTHLIYTLYICIYIYIYIYNNGYNPLISSWIDKKHMALRFLVLNKWMNL